MARGREKLNPAATASGCPQFATNDRFLDKQQMFPLKTIFPEPA
jgi:hypothetical protein